MIAAGVEGRPHDGQARKHPGAFAQTGLSTWLRRGRPAKELSVSLTHSHQGRSSRKVEVKPQPDWRCIVRPPKKSLQGNYLAEFPELPDEAM